MPGVPTIRPGRTEPTGARRLPGPRASRSAWLGWSVGGPRPSSVRQIATRRGWFGVVVGLLLALPAAGDSILLNNGRVIEADRVWLQGSQVLYERNGATFGLPRTLVARIEQHAPQAAASDPDVRRARAQLAAGDPVGATRLLVQALARDPSSLSAAQSLAEAYLALGDAHAAREAARKALGLDERNARSHALLGDALAALGDRSGAESAYRKSVQLHADPEVARKLGDFSPAPARPAGDAQFRLRFDGSVNQPLGAAVIELLGAAHAEYARRLGGAPGEPITVVLLTEEAFQAQRPPMWAAGVNDGTIRVPVRGLEGVTPELSAVLRHELAHSFVSARTGGNCPTWLQEGVAQWLEGGPPGRGDAALVPLARAGSLIALISLEGPFQSLSDARASQAYAQSLSAVAYVLRTRGEAGLIRLLSALGDGLPSEEALPVALALSYPELQKEWEQSLLGTAPRRGQ